MNQPFDVIQLLVLALGPLGVGKVVQLLVDWIGERTPRVLTSNERFYLAQILAFVVPLIAYSLLVGLGVMPWQWREVLLEIGVGYMVSQNFHRTDERRGRRAPSRGAGDNATPGGSDNRTQALSRPPLRPVTRPLGTRPAEDAELTIPLPEPDRVPEDAI